MCSVASLSEQATQVPCLCMHVVVPVCLPSALQHVTLGLRCVADSGVLDQPCDAAFLAAQRHLPVTLALLVAPLGCCFP